MQRPIVVITLLFVCGIYLGYLTDIPLSVTLVIAFFFWVFCLFCLCLHKFTALLIPCLSVFLITTSMAYYDYRTESIPANHIEYLLTTDKSLQRITGIIVKPPVVLDENILKNRLLRLQSEQMPGRFSYKISFTVRAEKIETVSGWKDISGYIKVNLYPSKDEILMADNILPILRELVYGQRVELFGRAFLPRTPGNPGEFDYKSYLRRQMPPVRCLMTVVNTHNIKPKGIYGNHWIYSSVYALKNYLNNTIYTYTFSRSAPLISSMLLGNRVDLPGEVIDNFMKTGIMHFIAISGLHVGIVIFTIFLPLRLLPLNQTAAIGIILVIIVLYALLTGLNPPVLRAGMMAIVFFCSFLIRRQWDITSGIFTAMFFILLRNPSDLFNIGFQLSVLATMGIVYGSSKIEGTLFKTAIFVDTLQVKAERGRFFFLKKYLRKSLCVSLAACLATLPLTSYYFHIVTPLVPVVNILVFPLFWAIIVCGIMLLTLGIICPPFAAFFAWLASIADIALGSLVSLLVSIPYSYFYVTGPSPPEIIVYYGFFLLLLSYTYLSLDPGRIIIWGLLSANIFVFAGIVKAPGNSLTVTCLDAGHGAAIFIQFPNGKNILYDAGSWHSNNVGRYSIAPFLWSRNIKLIDLVILSHEHEDHWNGLPAIAERFTIKSVYSQPHLFASKAGQRILSLLNKQRIPAATISYGEMVTGFEPAVVKILNPLPFASDFTRTNDNSCVLKIEYLGYSIILCADIEERGIELILSRFPEIKSDILQIPHHGSSIRNLKKFIDVVQPAYSFINTSDSIVSSNTLDLLENRCIMTLMTHKEGAITFTLDKNGIHYSSFRK
ncbi:MAG: DNA internalization-related competence protein ComEC/Rec2 [Candidatus Loosdrechtia sp.]|uniref:ComEC/Rec2 family competence protein n=1 Tax=Candidatus Loosdrechtia sp. TaxID=3101272 RepID=UPI003A69965E|nr:MAG: DNA internalization-related competence protein ComEC/Rec2 [Candidatus Jettenia sp. AMX2]